MCIRDRCALLAEMWNTKNGIIYILRAPSLDFARTYQTPLVFRNYTDTTVLLVRDIMFEHTNIVITTDHTTLLKYEVWSKRSYNFKISCTLSIRLQIFYMMFVEVRVYIQIIISLLLKLSWLFDERERNLLSSRMGRYLRYTFRRMLTETTIKGEI